MQPVGHLSISRAIVRGHRLARHAADTFDRGLVFAVSTGIGLPRTWQMTTDAVLKGFAEGLKQSRERGKSRLQQAFSTARRHLIAKCEMMIEQHLPDATLTCFLLDGAELHVLSAGAGRAYLHRKGNPQRLTPRNDPPEGILRAGPVRCRIAVEDGDLIIAGSSSAFSVQAVAQVASALDDDPSASPSAIANMLTEPAGEAGAGAAAVALRV